VRVNFAHLREQSTSGGWINFAVFDARSVSGSSADNAHLLQKLTTRAVASGLKIDQSALAFMENGRVTFYGSKNLVPYLSEVELPRWTHTIDV
jgi:hypothetical protein